MTAKANTSRRLPRHLTKVSYILAKTDKKRLMAAAKRAGCSMSEIITNALAAVGQTEKRIPHA